ELDSDAGQAAISELPRCAARPIAVDGAGRANGCVLLRPAEADFSYAEMVHPRDISHDQLSTANGAARLEHRLFARMRLEKGVILRGRVRAAWLPRHDDEPLARAIYQQFQHAELPLTT
ncbi:MAG TPA: hypothetical protein VG713_21645, partial [Pirellulales bacterium]|nr:hypothetical protein [Pirellulales bacterium]